MLLSLLTLLALNAPHALAQECDAREIKTRLAEASPQQIADVFIELAACDPKAATAAAETVFPKIITGEQGTRAAIAGIQAGAGTVVRTWVANQISDERSRTIADLGASCTGNAAVVNFFVTSQVALGERFWSQRWQRGLMECREPQIQELLRTAAQNVDNQKDASRFGSIVEAFARNLGRGSIPYLKALAITTSQDNQLRVVSAFADAVGVGSKNGMDVEAAREAVATLNEIAPQLPALVLEQTRIILQSLGDATSADNLAAVRYAASRQPSGSFLWGVVAAENATCKKGNTKIRVHDAEVQEPGHRWADQMQEAVDAAVKSTWTLDLATKCKGTGTTEVIIPADPLADPAAYAAWRDAQIKELEKRAPDKFEVVEEEPLVLP